MGILWYKLGVRFSKPSCHTPIGLHMQTKPNPRYFVQYKNPGLDVFGKNGTYGHPAIVAFWKRTPDQIRPPPPPS